MLGLLQLRRIQLRVLTLDPVNLIHSQLLLTMEILVHLHMKVMIDHPQAVQVSAQQEPLERLNLEIMSLHFIHLATVLPIQVDQFLVTLKMVILHIALSLDRKFFLKLSMLRALNLFLLIGKQRVEEIITKFMHF